MKILEDKVLKSNVLVILHGLLPLKTPNLFSFSFSIVHFDLFGENFHLSYLIINLLIPIAHFSFSVENLLCQVNDLNMSILEVLNVILFDDLQNLWNLWNIANLISMSCFRTLAFPTFTLLNLIHQVSHPLYCD